MKRKIRRRLAKMGVLIMLASLVLPSVALIEAERVRISRQEDAVQG
jgi:hypothetical protein